jgi:hypothetical protein
VRIFRFSAEKVVNKPRTGGGFLAFTRNAGSPTDPLGFAGVMVKPHATAGNEGNIAENVGGFRFENAVLQVLRVDELDGINDTRLFQDHAANQTIEIGTSNESHISQREKM